MPFYSIENGMALLSIKAQPAASKNEFCGLYGEESIKIRIRAAAVEGAANKELIKFLSKRFKIAKSDVVFKSGETSKIKRVTFPVTEQFKEFIREIEDGKSL
jgi:hypothetical protein